MKHAAEKRLCSRRDGWRFARAQLRRARLEQQRGSSPVSYLSMIAFVVMVIAVLAATC
ncbi:MAG: hypothetical protein AAGE52_03955 [Myxococcota bacterium]